MTREASRNDFSEQHCLRIISKKYYSMLKIDTVALVYVQIYSQKSVKISNFAL